MTYNYTNLNKELELIKKELKSIKKSYIDINKLDTLETKITQEIQQHFINNDIINQCNLDLLNLKLSIISIETDINDIKIKFNKSIKNQQIKLSDKLKQFLDINNLKVEENITILGCQTIQDILLLSEEELMSSGIPIVQARKIQDLAKKNIEQNDPYMYV